MSQLEANRALACVQAEEKNGTIPRVTRLFNEDRQGTIAYLCGDPLEAAAFAAAEPHWESLPLRQYFVIVYSPWRAEAAPGSWTTEERLWPALLTAMGDRQLSTTDAHLVADHLDALKITRPGARQGQPASGTYKRLIRAAIQALLNRAHRLRHIPGRVDLAVFRLVGATKTTTPREDPLSIEELQHLLNGAKNPLHRALFAVGGGQGLRPSELIRLDWQDVHWAEHTLDVRGAKTEASTATIPLTPLTYSELRGWWTQGDMPDQGIAFPSTTGRPYASSSGYKKGLSRAAERAGITRTVTPYLLRHSFATIAWGLGIEMEVARRVLRHTDEKMLREVYYRPRPADLVAKLEDFEFSEE